MKGNELMVWMVIYPMGNRELLSIAHMLDYEKDDYKLASLKEFKTEKEAAIYARTLSNKHNIKLEERPTSDLLHILDLENEDNE